MQNNFKHEWGLAFKRSSPFLLSAILSGVVFGTLAQSAGLAAQDSLLMSGLVYSGAAQFVGLQLLVSHADLAVVLITTFLLSLRFLLYSISLVDEVKAVPVAYRALLAFGLIDQVFFLAKDRYKEDVGEPAKHMYFLACVMIFYINWLLGTAIGIYVGDRVAGHADQLGFYFMAQATFVAMLGPYLKQKRYQMVSIITFAMYLLFRDLPYNLGIIAACLSAVLLAKIIQSQKIMGAA